MDDPKVRQNDDIDDDHQGTFKGRKDFLGFTNLGSQNCINLMKFILLLGAEKMLMTRKPAAGLALSSSKPCQDDEDGTSEEERIRGECVLQTNEKVCGRSEHYAGHSTSRFNKECEDSNGYLDVSKMVNCTTGGFNEFPLNIVALLAVVVLKLAGFQIGLIVRFFTLSIWLFNFWLTFITFPFQSLIWIKDHFRKKLLRMWSNLCLNVVSLICFPIRGQKSLLHMGMRFGRAFFWSIYVCSMLLGLLISGFIVSYLTMRQLLEEPITTSETLNFDYTKTSPVAFVPITSSPVPGVSPNLILKDRLSSAVHVGERFIPYNHKLRLTVSLTLPESEYNRKLGIFQVRVESLSANGKVIASSSYPSMLRFKSQPIHFAETIFKSIPLIAGFQSEVQNLKVTISDFTEGLEPTACFKVILEQRAVFQAGAGIPETYAASLDIESELPQVKRIIWSWRRTIFVWISMFTFLTEFMFVLIFCRPIILPGGKRRVAAAKKSTPHNKISW